MMTFETNSTVDKENGSNLAQVQVNKGQPVPAQSAPHYMNNGSRFATQAPALSTHAIPATFAASAAPPAAAAPPAVPAPPAAVASPAAAAPLAPAPPVPDVQKLQQQLQDIKEQVITRFETHLETKPVILFVLFALWLLCTKQWYMLI